MSAASALERSRSASAPDRNDPETWNALAHQLASSDEWLFALTALGRAHRLRPHSLEYAEKRAELAWRARTGEAELVRLDEFAAEHPTLAAPLAGRGILLHRLNRNAEAAEILEAACVLEPANPRLTALLAGILARDLKLSAAAAMFTQALAADPDNHALRQDYGVVLYRLHRFPQARRELLAALEGMGDTPLILSNLANVLLCMGLQEDALEIAERASAKFPGYSAARTVVSVLSYTPGIGSARLLTTLRACSDASSRSVASPAFANTRDPDRKLRVGLLGGLLKTHPVGWLTIAGFENLDPANFELVGIAVPMPKDSLGRRFHALARDWVDPLNLEDPALAEAVRAREIDVLIDLGGYGDLGRMAACAWRLAPVQVKWVGMQSHSSGLAEMDWFITDRWETPPEREGDFTERLLIMPDGYICYSPPPDAPPVQPLPMISRGHVTFGCFCSLAKVNAAVLDTWCEVLRSVPDARFILKSQPLADLETAARFREGFTARGMGPERVEFRGGSEHREFLAQWSDIDIALDTFPYSGGLTTVEALWMGVPTLTMPGETFASRHSFSHMSNAGLGDWAVGTLAEYVAQAVRRASDPETLSALRVCLRSQVRQSPLCDARRFGATLGAALRRVWADWCAVN